MTQHGSLPACVLFDLDGTLLDTAADFAAVLQQLADEAGGAAPQQHQLHQTVSAGARALVTLTLGLKPEDADFTRWHQRLLTLYGEQVQHSRATVYDGLNGPLLQLEALGIPWGVVTNKPESFSRTLLDALSLSRRCAVLVCPEHVRHTKPDPEPLLLACQRLERSAADSVYIGDHPRDVEAGRAAGMRTAVAAWGYLPADSNPAHWGADHILASAGDLASWLHLPEHQESS
ncbi:MAG: HAD-IA family hydrolase [Pseudohongiellaceae bacterium]